jgi:hypothetical protein
MELGHFLTRSGLTGLEVSWMVSSSFFCLLIYCLLVFSETCFCTFHYSWNLVSEGKKRSHYCYTTPHITLHAGHLRQHSNEIKNYSHPNEGNLLRMWVISVNGRQKRTISVGVLCYQELCFVMTVQQIRWQSKGKNSGSCTPDLHRPQNHGNNITLDVISDRVPWPLNVFAGIKSR